MKFWRRLLTMVVTAVCGSSLVLAVELSYESLFGAISAGETPAGGEIKGRCTWANGRSVAFNFAFTGKGNGWLDIGGQKIRVYYSHGDGCSYQRAVLEVEKTLDRGTPLLELKGMAEWTDDKGQSVIRRESVSLVFALVGENALELRSENPGAVYVEALPSDRVGAITRKSQSEWTNIIQREAELSLKRKLKPSEK